MQFKPGRSWSRPVLVLCTVVLAALGSWIFLSAPTVAPTDLEAAAQTSHSSAPTHAVGLPAVARFDATGQPEPSQPLPALDILVARADGGDAKAACQLAAEFHACDRAQWLDGKPRLSEEFISHQAEQLRNMPAEQARGIMQPLEARFRCQRLGEEHADRHFDWLRQAAVATEPEAMLRYATGQHFGASFGGDFSYLRSNRFEIWRREAPGMLQALFEAGYPDTLVFLLRSTDPMFGGHAAALLEPDPIRERAYLHLLALLAGRSHDVHTLVARLDQLGPGVDAQASALARKWHLDYFEGATIDARASLPAHDFPRMRASGQSCSQAVPGVKQ